MALAALADPIRLAIVRQVSQVGDWERTCASFDLPVGKASRTHHFSVLRDAGVIEQRDEGPHRLTRLRRKEFDECFPGLLDLVLNEPRWDKPIGVRSADGAERGRRRTSQHSSHSSRGGNHGR
ncbi:helix-turn-helix transcriptional regulator [Micromonospora sp. Llam0]|uniref:ArsR/SmtB family transcription factor n=1 Tax=Micromonospora sp. Llam0 TaxID=2485143 RepID=UPI0018F29A95|nr:helix-turn-helix transcriptional regulator [Micromonospora sp. Llam0]